MPSTRLQGLKSPFCSTGQVPGNHPERAPGEAGWPGAGRLPASGISGAAFRGSAAVKHISEQLPARVKHISKRLDAHSKHIS